MATDRHRQLEPLAPLADPVRRRLYAFVVDQDGPVDRDGAAAGAGVTRALAAFHLDRLAEAGLLDVHYRRRTGRSGPGAGRPAKFYERPAGREISVSLPPREYGLAAEILAAGVERRSDVLPAVMEAARERGRSLAAGPMALTGDRAGLLRLLAAHGFEPAPDPGGTVRLRNCPFDRLVTDHRELTCSMNLSLLRGIAEALPGAGVFAEARPEDGSCCVAFVPDSTRVSGAADPTPPTPDGG